MIKSIDKLKKINFSNIQKSFEKILPYLLPESWSKHKKKYILFWIISAFTITFLSGHP